MIRFLQGWTVAMLVVALFAEARAAYAYSADDVYQAIGDTAATYGVSPTRLTAIARCESGGTFDPNIVGDHGTSYGVVQLHRGGLYERFLAAGYDNPFDPWQALGYLARVIIGEFPGIGVSHWTCA